MPILLKKGHQDVIAQLCSLTVRTSISPTPMAFEKFINHHSKVFGEMYKGFPPTWDYDQWYSFYT